VDKPSTSIWQGTSHLIPDPLNHGWRDYGLRIGFWRMLGVFDELRIRPSVLLNSDVCRHYPQVIRAGVERDWAWLAHGRTNSKLHTGFSETDERTELREIVDTIRASVGTSPNGWMGPGLTETFWTPSLLRELGFSYVLDWCADDQPFPLTVPDMISVPYSVELNDIMLFVAKSFTGEDFAQAVIDQFEQLYADSASGGRVMALALHPFVVGQPFRLKYLRKALQHIAGHPGVWLATSDEIAEHYLLQQSATLNRLRQAR
jgi:peptidoglycan/xylan/chitin deacetylase (PgdA/CDA1 family)